MIKLRSLRRLAPVVLAMAMLGLPACGSARGAGHAEAAEKQSLTTVHVWAAGAASQPEPGAKAEAEGGALVVKLTGEAPWSNVLLTDRAPFDPRGVVSVDLAGIKDGDTTVQVACWDAQGKVLDSFDFLKAITTPDTYTMPLSAYLSAFPAGTKEISFRLWLGGKPSARAEYKSITLAVDSSAPMPKSPPPIAEHYHAAKAGTWNVPGTPPFVFAHYVDWFSLEKPLAGTAFDHWSRPGNHGHDATKRLPDGRRDIASVLYPLIGPYDSRDPNVVRYHLATMKAAGISGIIVDWYGKGHGSDDCLPVIFDEAEKLDLKVALCVEEKMFCAWKNPRSRAEMVDNMTGALEYALKTWCPRKAYLRRDGEPFFIQFNSYGTGKLGPQNLTPDEWRMVFSRLKQRIVYCRQNLEPMYHPPLQAAFVWWDEGNWPKEFAQKAADLRSQGRLEFFMSMLGVGFNDTGVWGWGEGPRVSRGYGLDVLKKTEQVATLDGPELIQMVTWNDFNEGTCFEPTVQHGFEFVDEVEKFIGQLHGRPVNLQDNRLPYEQYKRNASEREKQELPAGVTVK